jgi:hypothetical protein
MEWVGKLRVGRHRKAAGYAASAEINGLLPRLIPGTSALSVYNQPIASDRIPV